MTQRERQTSGTRTNEDRGMRNEEKGLSALSSCLGAGSAVPVSGLRWEELFRSVSPAQQQELVTLAARQGLLYGHQLPPVRNGTAAPPASETAARQFLSRLLGGHVNDLEPVRAQGVTVADS